jgi:DNA ligase (NAD+)
MGNLETLAIDLNKQLEAARHAYYVLAAPIITDAEYDVLEAQLTGLVAANPSLAPLAPVLTSVGSDTTDSPLTAVLRTAVANSAASDAEMDALPVVNDNGRIKHVRPMLSIENKYTKDDVVTFCLGLPSGTAFDIEPKRDGISCELTYVNGWLTQAVTRGTGTEGENMLEQVKTLRDVPQFLTYAPLLDSATELRIRGELVMTDDELARINAEATARGTKTYASTRNLTAGTMKQKDMSVVASREIILVPWDVYSPQEDGKLPDSNNERMQLLASAGFPKYDGIRLAGAGGGIPEAIDKILAENAKSNIRADGVVIKVDSHKLRKELGVASKFTNWMSCFKPQSASGTTYLRSITWQVGRQGALTPVATCDAVVLAGASVTRATLNNETWIATMGLTLGAKVEMLRSGDVIPQIVKVLDDTGDPIVPPSECPECNSKLVVYTDKNSGITSRYCDSIECPGRVRGTLSYIGSRDILEIDGLADDMASKLVKNQYARNLGELFQFQVEALESLNLLKAKYGEEPGENKFLTRMAAQGFSVIIVRMLKSLETAKTAGWDRWISALGIPFVGRTLGKLLAKELKLEADDMPNLCAKLEAAANRSIDGLGDVKSDILRKWSLDPVNRDMCVALFDSGVRPKATVTKVADGVGQPLVGVAFCITGEFDEDREKLTAKLESLGAVAKSGVSKNLTHLIVGEGAGKSKLLKYDELVAKGCKIQKVGKDWLTSTLEASGMSMKNTSFAVDEV